VESLASHVDPLTSRPSSHNQPHHQSNSILPSFIQEPSFTQHHSTSCITIPRGESLEATFHTLVIANIIVFPHTKPFDKNKPKPTLYKEHNYCNYHKIQGNSINQCLKFKTYVQNIIDNGDIELEVSVATPNNQPSPNH